MPGYDINRFVDLTQNEKSELICSICQDILRCPVVTICCLQAFCDDCINEWLESTKTCPYDRKILTTDQLLRAPRMVVNLLGKLRIRCDFSDNGCNQVIALEDLSNHLKQCQYKECEKCLCKNCIANHDCVEYLLDTNNRLTVELNQLKISYKESLETSCESTTELNQLKLTHEKLFEAYINSTTELNQLKRSYDCIYQSLQELKLKKENEVQTNAQIIHEVQSKPSIFRKIFKSDKKTKAKNSSDPKPSSNCNMESYTFDDEHKDLIWTISNDDLVNTDELGVPIRALYDYCSDESDELTFKKGVGKLFTHAGDEFEKLMDIDGGWCYGRMDARTGLFPANYVEVISNYTTV